jgi:hypothetical protein
MRSAVFLWCVSFDAICQAPHSDNTSPQVQKQWEPGPRVSSDPEQRDGSVTNPAILEYLQHIESMIASAVGAQPMKVRLTRSTDWYAIPGPNLLYISRGLLGRIENESELAGLFAHELAHILRGLSSVTARTGCVLAPRVEGSSSEDLREREKQATTIAVMYMKSAGYDPVGVLDLFSKLAYERPAWGKAIIAADLLELRAQLEVETVPPSGYRLESSQFRHVHFLLDAIPGKAN